MKKVLLYTDEDLLQQCQQGNQLAFKQLVIRYEQQVRSTVAGMLSDTAEAEDVAQQVFIRFYRALFDFRGDAQLGTYLTRIAINLSLNEIKRRQRKKRWLTFFQKGDKTRQIEDVSANPAQQDTKELVYKALQELEPHFRSVIVLRLLEGYSVKEVAEMLELPQGTVASRLSRAQRKLKDILVRWGIEEV